MVLASPFQRRRRSNVDSTLPSEVACTHRDVDDLWADLQQALDQV